MHFWMNVNRACVSSFTEAAFVICVHAHRVAFVPPEMLHTGGRDLHFHANWGWLPFSVSFAFYSLLLMNYCCFWNSGLRFSYHFSVALFLFTCLLLLMTSAAATCVLQQKLFTSELVGLVIGNISYVKSPELREHLLFSLFGGASPLAAHM